MHPRAQQHTLTVMRLGNETKTQEGIYRKTNQELKREQVSKIGKYTNNQTGAETKLE